MNDNHVGAGLAADFFPFANLLLSRQTISFFPFRALYTCVYSPSNVRFFFGGPFPLAFVMAMLSTRSAS